MTAERGTENSRAFWGRSATPLPFGQFAYGKHGLRYAAPKRNPRPLKTPSQRDILYTSNTVEQGPKVLLILHRQLSKDGGSLTAL